jgi:hypothetical protein
MRLASQQGFARASIRSTITRQARLDPFYLVAVGLLGHAAWDAIHWRRNTIVTRSFAEWCGVLVR